MTKFLVAMTKHIIYFATDANRMNIEIGYCNNILDITPNRVVYTKEYPSFDEAQKQKLVFLNYTRMMKERIIRKHNPNWLNIISTPLISNRAQKIVAYAF